MSGAASRQAAEHEESLVASHKASLEEARSNWEREKAALSEMWAARLAAARDEAETRYKALQQELEAKVVNI